MHTFDTIIIGGGVVGLTLASLLAKEDLSVALVDQQALPAARDTCPRTYDLRVNALHHASQKIFHTLGVWEAMQTWRVSPYLHMRVWDASSPAEITFDCTEVSQPYLGHIVEQRVMRHSLWQHLQAHPNVHIYPASNPRIVHQKSDAVTLELHENVQMTGRLLVGADGKDSWVAKQAFPTEHVPKISTQTAVVATLHTEKPHQKIALQRFLPTGPIALLPLADPHQVSLVWSTLPSEAVRLHRIPDAAFHAEVTQAMEYALGPLTLCDQRVVFPLYSHQAPHYVKARVALVGDAAHTILPLAGQGLNLGLLDAACLAQILIETHQKGRDIGQIQGLRRYARWRKAENILMQRAMEGLHLFFTQPAEVTRHLRHAGLRIVHQLPLLKKYLMSHAMGLSGDLPEIAK
jgi:2-octaprenylphenol hydroxylase